MIDFDDYFCLQVVASLYLVMVVVVVGMNYTLKQRSERIKDNEIETGVEDKKSSECIFEEGKGLITKVIDEENEVSIDKGKVENL